MGVHRMGRLVTPKKLYRHPIMPEYKNLWEADDSEELKEANEGNEIHVTYIEEAVRKRTTTCNKFDKELNAHRHGAYMQYKNLWFGTAQWVTCDTEMPVLPLQESSSTPVYHNIILEGATSIDLSDYMTIIHGIAREKAIRATDTTTLLRKKGAKFLTRDFEEDDVADENLEVDIAEQGKNI